MSGPDALAAPVALATRLFDELRAASHDPPGVTRASYGPGERAAHEIVARAAIELGLEATADAIGTLRIRLPGSDPAQPAVAIGSHLDSVPHGGNYDGAAGVVMGLAAAEALRQTRHRRDLLLLGFRAEEMCWFPANYLGSRALFGQLPQDAPDTLRRSDTGRSLAAHMADEGLDPGPIRRRQALLDPARLAWFIEPHIEQGPVLVEEGVPVGIVTGIRGSIRYPRATVTGAHAHAGAVPRRYRQDAALAAAALLAALDERWTQVERDGGDLVCTCGILATDPAHHAPTKIPGVVRFSLDIRSESAALLAELRSWLAATTGRIEQERHVHFDLGPLTDAAPAVMDAALRTRLHASARTAGITVRDIASGAGHDCATLATLGVPSAMLFLRNRNGSHNPDEAMDMTDFAAGLAVLLPVLAELLDT